METIFTKIRDGVIPSVKLHEDELCFVILDINPVNKGHLLVITNECHPTLADCPEATLAHLMGVVQRADAKLREALGCDATNIVINNGEESGQEVKHLHIHVIPRYKGDQKHFRLAKEHYEEGEMERLGRRLEF
ncbi:MAG: HIT family protein [Sphaerochaeta sp.]|nr:HIT family protein [Sphaerochaeta sp.]MDX9915307.1 HIT family protein [Sphaerochaeta sp.]